MKVLVTGSSGLPGRDVLRQLDGRSISCRGTDTPEFRVTDSNAVYRLVDEYAPDVIVHCAAYTNVDKAESEPATCAAVNGSGALTMARAALRVGARLLLLSTVQVFSGEGDRAYSVSAPYGPKNVYAMSMVQAEDAVRSLMTQYYIVRTGSVFGNSKDPVRSVLRAAQDRRSLTLSCDRIIQPTWSKDLARVICDLVMTDSFGIWHARNKGACTPAEFAEMVMKKTGVSCQIIPVHDAELPSHARRPLNSRLAAKLPDGITPMPDLGDALDRYLQEIIR
jgi:dTDP-4-dehydrorhamnose reductase